MTVEYLPVGVKCNLKCTYCYQEPMRDAGNFSVPANFDKVKEQIKKVGTFSVFGGEPLLAPIEHLRELWEFGDTFKNNNGLQTNGLLITHAHVELFKKHKVHVGISIDGPGACNGARSSLADTAHIINNIKGLVKEGINVSLIITIHKLNYDNISDLLQFIDEMLLIGIVAFNFHNLEVDNSVTEKTLHLDDAHNFAIFQVLYEHTRTKLGHFNPFNDIKCLLTQEKPSVSCIWTSCDPVTTPAVHGINAEGALTNCGRTNKEGIDWLKSESPRSLERYLALSLTEWKNGGCKDCQYFFVCKGNCPGTSIGGDWRNRTRDCLFWYQLIDSIRQDLLDNGHQVLDSDEANKKFIQYINQDTRFRMESVHQDVAHGDSHGDHTDQSGVGPRPTD